MSTLVRRILGLALILAAGLIGGALPSHAEDKPAVIRIGVAMAGVGGRPFSAGTYISAVHVKGLLEKEFAADGTKVEWNFFGGAGPAVNEALASGKVDFAWQGDLPALVGRSLGLKTRLLLATGTRFNTYIAVPADSPLKTLADIKGHTVSNFNGTLYQLTAANILSTVGLTYRDLKIVNLDNATALSALSAHQVDAAFTSYYSFGLREKGLIKYLYTTKGQDPKLTSQAGFLVTDDFAKTHPSVVNRVVKVLVGEARWASEPANQPALYDIWAKVGIPAAFFAEAQKGEDPKVLNSPLFDPFITAQFKRSAENSLHFKLIRSPADVDSWIDREPLNAALKSLGLENYWPQFDKDGKPVVAQ